MSKRKLRSSGFANGVLNSYNFIIEKDLFVENCSLCDYYHKNFDYPEKPLKYKHIRRISD